MSVSSKYDMHSQFDIEKHKATFGSDYLEAIIDADGNVQYGVPCHKEKAMLLAMEKLGKTRKEIDDMCPKRFYLDHLNWLLSLTDSVAIWSTMLMAPRITKKHLKTLRELKLCGVYHGPIPKLGVQHEDYIDLYQ